MNATEGIENLLNIKKQIKLKESQLNIEKERVLEKLNSTRKEYQALSSDINKIRVALIFKKAKGVVRNIIAKMSNDFINHDTSELRHMLLIKGQRRDLLYSMIEVYIYKIHTIDEAMEVVYKTNGHSGYYIDKINTLERINDLLDKPTIIEEHEDINGFIETNNRRLRIK